MTTTLLILLIPVIIFIAMHFISKASKSLHYALIGISIVTLFVSQFYQFEKNPSNLVLIIALVIFGNFYYRHRKAI
jgi:chromate transport protein ChrA